MLYADIKLNVTTERATGALTTTAGVEHVIWRVGKEAPIKKWVGHTKDGLFEGCTYLQADGDELNHIRRNFDNLPVGHRQVVVWTGDLADFIFRNL